MKWIMFLIVFFAFNVMADGPWREIPLTRLPTCKTWIPEGRIWGCVNIERTEVATRATIEALVEEIKELKARLKALEDLTDNQ